MNNKYPRATKFLAEHPEMTVDEAIAYLDKELRRGDMAL